MSAAPTACRYGVPVFFLITTDLMSRIDGGEAV